MLDQQSSNTMEKIGLYSYVIYQCGDDTVLLGGGLPKQKSMTRVVVSPDGINSSMSMTKVSLQNIVHLI